MTDEDTDTNSIPLFYPSSDHRHIVQYDCVTTSYHRQRTYFRFYKRNIDTVIGYYHYTTKSNSFRKNDSY